MMQKEDLAFFNLRENFSVVERKLPHWIQQGALCFVTWRAEDSLPTSVLPKLDSKVEHLLSTFGIDPSSNWNLELREKSSKLRAKIYHKLFLIRDKFLDRGYGRCLLSAKECAVEVEKSLLHFDEDRYFITDIVVMPNHVHFIVAFKNEEFFLKQNTDWKRYTARSINRICKVAGPFWQVDQFDHLVRHQDAFDYYRAYIQNNPSEAGLNKDSFRHFSKGM